MYLSIIIITLFMHLCLIEAFNKIINIRKNIRKNIAKINEYKFYETNKYNVYKKYINYSKFQAINFLNFYKIKVKNYEEFYMYANFGLYKAIINYHFNDETMLLFYMKKYIYAELYNYMSDSYSLNTLPKYIRKYKKYNHIKNNINNKIILFTNNYNFFLNTVESSSKISNVNQIWKSIYDNLDSVSFTIFRYKYDYNFDIIRSNLEISKILGLNEEYVRIKINKSKNIIRDLLKIH